ncbi:TIR domain-containing protein [Pseudarthrobacter sp. DSP2-3-2b1]|uniref:TIR domain-containing protein n=1 Tax=Pseudarthrobacter sp. DSP2-3-2b1 TaxID=2804661 RepID=UPI003CE8E800
MSYRNKTYVAFASEDILSYRLMEAWRENKNIDFNFYDAHDLYEARDSSRPETIKGNLRERMKNAKQIVLLGSPSAKKKGGDGASFLAYELQIALEFNLPIVVAHLDKSRKGNGANYPKPLSDANHHTISVSFQPTIIKYALDNYAPGFASSAMTGERIYSASVYTGLGL